MPETISLADKLQQDIDVLTADILKLRESIKPIQRELSQLESNRQELEMKLAEAKMEPRVSDHAVIRYLERVHDFDFEEQRKELLTPAVLTAIKMGAKKVKRDGYTLVIANNTIVTIH